MAITLEPGASMTFPLPDGFRDDLTKLVLAQNVMNNLVKGFVVAKEFTNLNVTWYGDLDKKTLTITGAEASGIKPATEPPPIPDAFKDAWPGNEPPTEQPKP